MYRWSGGSEPWIRSEIRPKPAKPQSPRATEVITQQLSEQEPGFVSLVTILEVFWVLKSVFRRSRQNLAGDIEKLLSADTLEIQNEQEVYNAVISSPRPEPGASKML